MVCYATQDAMVGIRFTRCFSNKLNIIKRFITNSRQGNMIENLKLDILVYADDIIIMNTTKKGIQSQLQIENFGYEFDIKYNPEKSVYMVYNMDVRRNSNIQDS